MSNRAAREENERHKTAKVEENTRKCKGEEGIELGGGEERGNGQLRVRGETREWEDQN
jgi:hypothetical protein